MYSLNDSVRTFVSRFKYCKSTATHGVEFFPFQLCLRRWEDFDPSAEFRCFVYSHQLIGKRYSTISILAIVVSLDGSR